MKEAIIKGKSLVLKQSYPFRLAVISDLQVGGQFGLSMPLFEDAYGTQFKIGASMRGKLWEYFEDFISHAKKNKCQALLVVGDLLSGQNPKDSGAYELNIDLETQKEMCAKVIAYLCEKVPTIKKVFLWKGTPYHGSRDTAIELHVTDKLNANHFKNKKVRAFYLGEWSYVELRYKRKKKLLWVGHPSTGAVMYPEQAMGRDIMLFLEKAAQGKVRKPDLIIRAHKHEYIEVHKSGIRAIQLPCWQFFVPYDQAVKYYPKWQPDIGGCIILVDDELRLRPWHFTYPNVEDPRKYLVLNKKPTARKNGRTLKPKVNSNKTQEDGKILA